MVPANERVAALFDEAQVVTPAVPGARLVLYWPDFCNTGLPRSMGFGDHITSLRDVDRMNRMELFLTSCYSISGKEFTGSWAFRMLSAVCRKTPVLFQTIRLRHIKPRVSSHSLARA